MTSAEARFNKSLRPRKPEGSLGRIAQDGHLDYHTAPELCLTAKLLYPLLYLLFRGGGGWGGGDRDRNRHTQSSGFMSDKTKNRTTPLNSLNRVQTWQRPPTETRHVKKVVNFNPFARVQARPRGERWCWSLMKSWTIICGSRRDQEEVGGAGLS